MVWLWAHNVGAHASWGARIVWNVADAGFHAVKFRISKQVTLLPQQNGPPPGLIQPR